MSSAKTKTPSKSPLKPPSKTSSKPSSKSPSKFPPTPPKPSFGSKGSIYDVIVRPVVTEKSTMSSERNQFVFEVRLDATKPRIRLAIESLFGVRTTAINTRIRKGKTKRYRGRSGRRSDVKHAIVTLSEGDAIDMGTGL